MDPAVADRDAGDVDIFLLVGNLRLHPGVNNHHRVERERGDPSLRGHRILRPADAVDHIVPDKPRQTEFLPISGGNHIVHAVLQIEDMNRLAVIAVTALLPGDAVPAGARGKGIQGQPPGQNLCLAAVCAQAVDRAIHEEAELSLRGEIRQGSGVLHQKLRGLG